MLKKILSNLLIASTAYGNCDIPTRIEKDAKSPCDGYVISTELETKIRTDLAYKDALIKNLTQINASQEKILKIDAEQLKIYESMSRQTMLDKTLYFGLGAIVTGLVAYGTVRALR